MLDASWNSQASARAAKLLAEENHDALVDEAVRHLGDYAPLSVDAPPSWLATAIEQARQLEREGNMQAARNIVQNNTAQGAEFGKWREHVTWVEAANARRLSGLAWLWAKLYKRPQSAANDAAIERVERFAYEVWHLQGLRADRCWAEAVTQQLSVLPQAWRAA